MSGTTRTFEPNLGRMETAQGVPARVGATELRVVAGGDTATGLALAGLYADAYTGLALEDATARERFAARIGQRATAPGSTYLAAYRNDRLVGAMRWHDFRMNWRGNDVVAAGLGAVAVALDARKRGVAHDLVRAFVETYRERGALVTLLHPFRHYFYRQMGFGHGTKMNRYVIAPLDLPGHGDAMAVRRLGLDDAEAIGACYERIRTRTNGLLGEGGFELRRVLAEPATRVFGYVDPAGTLRGYFLAFPFQGEPANSNTNELRVEEPMYETPEAFAALLAFLRSLADQFRAIVFQTQDQTLHFIARDPRNGTGRIVRSPAYHETNAQGAGVMYRFVDVRAALSLLRGREAHGCPPQLRLTVRDSFLTANSATSQLSFANGCLEACDPVPDGALAGADEPVLTCDVAEFSSLAVGSVRLRALHDYGLARLSAPVWLDALDAFFACDPARCTTGF